MESIDLPPETDEGNKSPPPLAGDKGTLEAQQGRVGAVTIKRTDLGPKPTKGPAS